MRNLLILFVVGAVLVSCIYNKDSRRSPVSKIENESVSHEDKHWGYEGETSPEHWVEIEEGSDCDGVHQSPINIIDIDSEKIEKLEDFEIFYSSETELTKVENNGHTVKFDFEPGDSIRFNNDIYHLKQIHFHIHSEHQVNGVIYPIETHLVHVSKSNDITVLAIFGIEGNENLQFEGYESYLPLKMGESKAISEKKDLNLLFPESKSFYHYKGSLTTPPCWENVNWIVYKQPIELSLGEVLKLKHDMPSGNYRNEQPLNGRKIYSVE